MGGLGLTNTVQTARSEYSASIKVSAPLAHKIMPQSHENPGDAIVQTLVNEVRKEKDDGLKQKLEEVKNSLPQKARRAEDLSREKGTSSWLTVIPCKDMDFDLNKRDFRDAIRLRYDWPIPDSPSVCMWGC